MVRICDRCLNPELTNIVELEVYGKRFPNFYKSDEVPPTVNDYVKSVALNSPVLYIEFSDTISASKGITINFNDGTKDIFYPKIGSSIIEFSYNSGNSHDYIDVNTKWRFISLIFNGNIENVIRYDSRYIRGIDSLPALWKMKNLNNLTITEGQGIIELWIEGLSKDGYNDIQSDILGLSNLKVFNIDNSLLLGSKVTNSIPIGLFNTKLESLNYGGNNLGNVISNNFDKLPLLKTTLRELKISNSNLSVNSFPDNWTTNTSLKTVWFHGFKGDNSNIGKLLIPSINLFYVISNNLGDPNDFDNWLNIPLNSELVTLQIYGSLNDPSKLPTNLQNANKLKNIFFGHSTIALLKTTEEVTAFIDSWYNFITTFASMDPKAADQKFRGITFDFRGGSIASTYVSPNGFVLGSSNGTPTTIGQKIWVLDNQYGHHNSYTP